MRFDEFQTESEKQVQFIADNWGKVSIVVIGVYLVGVICGAIFL